MERPTLALSIAIQQVQISNPTLGDSCESSENMGLLNILNLFRFSSFQGFRIRIHFQQVPSITLAKVWLISDGRSHPPKWHCPHGPIHHWEVSGVGEERLDVFGNCLIDSILVNFSLSFGQLVEVCVVECISCCTARYSTRRQHRGYYKVGGTFLFIFILQIEK